VTDQLGLEMSQRQSLSMMVAVASAPPPGDEFAKRFTVDAGMAWRALLRHYRLSKPLIAAVEGPAIAGGTEILQATDIRVAGEGATFGVAEVRRGLFPLGGSTVRLRRQIPYTLAAEMLLTGKTITAEEALQYGLIGHVVPKGQALTKALEIADQIGANGPLAVKAVLRSLRETEGVPEEEALKIELEIGMAVFATNDAKEGPRAFAEKRPAQFTGT
jgi:enoyl-CoA hydratase